MRIIKAEKKVWRLQLVKR